MSRALEMIDGKVFGYEVSAMQDWKIVSGVFKEMVMQDFIITKYGYEMLKKYTDELVLYNEKLDMYIWAATRLNHGWAYVLTDIKLREVGEEHDEQPI